VVGVIGDAEQSIYGFLDAHPEHFLSFRLPDYLDVTMRHNRRSTQHHLDPRPRAVWTAYGNSASVESRGNP
jgi:superfamily I DNA/RNA helicase